MKSHRKYKDKIVVITGTTRGLGRFICEYFLSEGAKVIGIARNQPSFNHPHYTHLHGIDIGNDQQVQRAFQKIRKIAGKLDILINNAGVSMAQYALVLPASKAQEIVNTNILGTFYVSRAAARLLIRNKRGRIINISSMAAIVEPIGCSIYAASKVAITTLANTFAKEFSQFRITFNTLGITTIETDMLNQLSKNKIDEYINMLPLPRHAKKDDIFNVIDFFASDRSDYVTAQTLFLGGIHQ